MPTSQPQSGWESYELVSVDSAGAIADSPVTDALAGSQDAVRVYKLINRVEELGWKDARKLTIGPKNKRRIVKKDKFIYLLKCTPSCWRLYFYVREDSQRFAYVHAVCKKQDSEDPSDAAIARQRYDNRASGGLARIAFPS